MRRRPGLASRARTAPFVRRRPFALVAFVLVTLLGCSGPAPEPTITVQGRVPIGPMGYIVELEGAVTIAGGGALGMSLVVGNNVYWHVTAIDAADLTTAARVADVGDHM